MVFEPRPLKHKEKLQLAEYHRNQKLNPITQIAFTLANSVENSSFPSLNGEYRPLASLSWLTVMFQKMTTKQKWRPYIFFKR